MSSPFLAISDLLGVTPEFRAVTAGVAQDVGSLAARDLAVIKAGPPPPGVTRLDLRMATDAIVTGPDAWTPAVTSRTLLPSRLSSVEGHGGVTTDPHAIAVLAATIAHARPPARTWRDTFLEDAARNVSTIVQLIAPELYCGFGVLALGCAFGLWIYRRRRGLGAAFP
jgi:CBS domain-containing protein